MGQQRQRKLEINHGKKDEKSQNRKSENLRKLWSQYGKATNEAWRALMSLRALGNCEWDVTGYMARRTQLSNSRMDKQMMSQKLDFDLRVNKS